MINEQNATKEINVLTGKTGIFLTKHENPDLVVTLTRTGPTRTRTKLLRTRARTRPQGQG